MQEATVLVRIPGTTRDKLLKLAQPGPYQWSRPESLGAIITRLADKAPQSSSSKKSSSSSGKRSGSPKRRRRRGRKAAR